MPSRRAGITLAPVSTVCWRSISSDYSAEFIWMELKLSRRYELPAFLFREMHTEARQLVKQPDIKSMPQFTEYPTPNQILAGFRKDTVMTVGK